MKKLFACLLAAVLSVGVISLAACSNQQTEDGGEEEFNKIPQIPAGVVLNDVADAEIANTATSFNNARYTSKNLKAEYYRHYSMSGENDGEVTSIDENEVYIKAKYLEKDGKVYAESNKNVMTRNKNKYYIDEENKYLHDSDVTNENSSTAFAKDKNLGSIANGNKSYGHAIDELQGIDKEFNNTDDAILMWLEINGEDCYTESFYQGIGKLNAAYAYIRTDYVPWIPVYQSFVLDSTDVNTHLTYKQTQQIIWLLNDYPDVDQVEYMNDTYEGEVLRYSFTMQADGSKVYIWQDFKINFKHKENDKLSITYEYTFAYYQDIESNLTPNNFKENYITDELVKDIYYYDCDEKQVATDFMAGKDVVINPVGGDDVSDNSFNYEDDYIKTSSSPYVAFVDGNKIIEGYIAGFVNDSHAKVENGKVIINSDGALDVAKEYAKSTIEHGHYDSFDLENAKMYLVITAPNYYGNYKLYIPLN